MHMVLYVPTYVCTVNVPNFYRECNFERSKIWVDKMISKAKQTLHE